MRWWIASAVAVTLLAAAGGPSEAAQAEAAVKVTIRVSRSAGVSTLAAAATTPREASPVSRLSAVSPTPSDTSGAVNIQPEVPTQKTEVYRLPKEGETERLCEVTWPE